MALAAVAASTWHAFAATSSATPGATTSPSPSPLPTDAAVAYQINPAHSGTQSGDPLKPGLARRWEVDLEGNVSYPLIADGNVYVTVAFPAALPAYTRLYALDPGSGRSVWAPVDLPTAWATSAYDAGRLFVQLGDGTLKAFDGRSGASLWSLRLPGIAGYDSPPTATGGTIFTAGGGYVDAVSESTGKLLWSTKVMNGDASSPAVTSAGVYVGYVCNQDYDLNPTNGGVIWHHTSSCQGGGGLTPVPWNGRVYVRDPVQRNLILDSASGAELGVFTAGPAPAFDGSTGFFLDRSGAGLPPADGGTLEARDTSTGAVKWTFSGDGGLKSAPIVSGGYVYEGSSNGALYALAENTGEVVWSDRVSTGFTNPDGGQYPALAIGQGGLAAPFGNSLIFYTSTVGAAPSSQPTSGSDTAVAYQLDAQHSGGQSTDPLRLPAKRLWGSAVVGTPSYPLIVGGRIYLTLSGSPTRLTALNAVDGSAPWPAVDLSTSWALPAYESGRIFTISADGRLRAFDAATGGQLWQTALPQTSFHSAPTAANGSVYVSGRGAGNGTLFAVDEHTGAVRWSQNIAGGDQSAPLVTTTGVYVSYTCPQVYDFDPVSGHLIWHIGSASCTPDAGRTPVLTGGRLYIRDTHTGLILDPSTGTQLGVFQSRVAPAFSGSMAFYNNGGALEGWDLTTSSMVWRFDADDGAFAESAPVVVNGNVFQMFAGNLYAIDGKTGRQVWVGAVGAEPIAYESGSGNVLGGIAAGGGYIVVPGGGQITVFGTGGAVNPPTATPADASVSHQVNPVHSGGQSNDGLTPPLAQKWSIDLGGTVSYPLIAAGRVFVVVQPAGNVGPRLYALERATGKSIWGPIPLSDVRGHAVLAYDNGRVYVTGPGPGVVPPISVMHAFDAANGTEIWSRGGVGNPVASKGRLFAGPRRLDEETGRQVWHPVTYAVDGFLDDVTQNGIYLTEGCEFAFDMSPADGAIVWKHNGTQCTSGPAGESVVYGGRLYGGPEAVTPPRAILDATTGAEIGRYTSDTTPAFAGNLAYFMRDHTLEAHNLPGLGMAWTFAGDGGLVTAPLVVNGVVYAGSSSGNLYGLDAATGTLRWSGSVGAPMNPPDAWYLDELTGFGAAEGTLVVPAGTRLVAYVSAATPSPTPSPTPTATPSRIPANQSSASPIVSSRPAGQSSPGPSPSARSSASPSPPAAGA